MRRGTTPVVTVEVDKDITDHQIYLTFKQGLTEVTKTNSDLEVTEHNGRTLIGCPLTQADTLSFEASKPCNVQIRAIKDGNAIATTIGKLDVGAILKGGVINE